MHDSTHFCHPSTQGNKSCTSQTLYQPIFSQQKRQIINNPACNKAIKKVFSVRAKRSSSEQKSNGTQIKRVLLQDNCFIVIAAFQLLGAAQVPSSEAIDLPPHLPLFVSTSNETNDRVGNPTHSYFSYDNYLNWFEKSNVIKQHPGELELT